MGNGRSASKLKWRRKNNGSIAFPKKMWYKVQRSAILLLDCKELNYEEI